MFIQSSPSIPSVLDPEANPLPFFEKSPVCSSHSDSGEESVPFEDPLFKEKLALLDDSDGDVEQEPETILKSRTIFHWEANSPPKLFRKTPHRS